MSKYPADTHERDVNFSLGFASYFVKSEKFSNGILNDSYEIDCMYDMKPPDYETHVVVFAGNDV